jgi:RNA polymerase sigma factor (sigma-70 family)
VAPGADAIARLSSVDMSDSLSRLESHGVVRRRVLSVVRHLSTAERQVVRAHRAVRRDHLTFRAAALSNMEGQNAIEGVDDMTTPARSESGRRVGGRPKPRDRAINGTRRQLLNVSYRLLGSLAEAEDVVQEAYARWYAMSPQEQDAIASPPAWLTTVASRLCLNVLSSARVRREAYVGEWLPEPVPESDAWHAGYTGGAAVDPADRVTLDESINMAFLVVLESMTPAERVAFILHDVFCYSFAEVADVVGRTPAACRQLASSARHRIRSSRTPTVPTTEQAGIIRQFKVAWEAGDIDALVALLAPDVTAVGDGGGRVNAVRHPITGIDQIVRSFVRLRKTFTGLTIAERSVNGQPGLVVQQDGVTVSVYAFEIAGEKITHIWAVRNPDKLQSWADVSAL